MPKIMHFLSGLPRSGSTLLASILAQNPEIYANISSPLLDLVNHNIRGMSQCSEFASLISDKQRKSIITGLFASYYKDRLQPVVFDTNRWWTSKIDLIVDLFPNAKIIVCVRSVREIANSFELLYRRNKLQASAIYGFKVDTNIYTRMDMLLTGRGAILGALQSLSEAYYGPYADRLLLLNYNSLLSKPTSVLKKLYQLVDVKYYKPNLHELRGFETSELDLRLGTPSLHAIRRRLEKSNSKLVLPPDIVERCDALDFWRNKRQIRREVKCV